MKITKLETIYIKPYWMILKMHTDEGIVGLGEPIAEGHPHALAKTIEEIGDYLVGEDPRRVEHHWQSIYRHSYFRLGLLLCSALSAVEQAMWDITGKWLGQPVHRLWGGPTRDRIRMYGWLGVAPYSDLVESARDWVARGFTAIKCCLFDLTRPLEPPAMTERVVRQMAALREAVGPEVDIAVDFHGRSSPALSIGLAQALEPYHPLFIEEPVLPENVDALATVARSTSIPIATGERLYTRWNFREILEKQAAAVLQPDLSHAGGLFECRKIAAMAECYYASMAPHAPTGPINLAAALQLDACIPNLLIQEHVCTGEGYIKEPFRVVDGYIKVPDKPGLGIELDEDALADKLHDGRAPAGRFRHKDDGSVADL
jgi:galactonate dehydratase